MLLIWLRLKVWETQISFQALTSSQTDMVRKWHEEISSLPFSEVILFHAQPKIISVHM